MPLDNGTRIAKLMRRYYIFLLKRGADDAAEGLGIELVFNLENENVQRILGELEQLIRGVAETTRKEVATLVGQGAREGWSVQELADKIREAGITRSKIRATAIAHTESARGYVLGNLLAYRESGQVSHVEWLVAPNNPCPICEEFAGKRVPLGEAFAEGIAHPPAHTECRCDLVPVLREG